MMQTVPGSQKYYCRVEGCVSFTADNVPFGYCAGHLAEYLNGAQFVEKLGFANPGTTMGQSGVYHGDVSPTVYTPSDRHHECHTKIAQLEADLTAARLQLADIAGALTDAGDIPVIAGQFADAIRRLIADRTAARSARTDLDRAHAELHYGKYSAGYNRGLDRGRAEVSHLIAEGERYRACLRDLLELDQTADVLPEDWRDRVAQLLEG